MQLDCACFISSSVKVGNFCHGNFYTFETSLLQNVCLSQGLIQHLSEEQCIRPREGGGSLSVTNSIDETSQCTGKRSIYRRLSSRPTFLVGPGLAVLRLINCDWIF